MNVLIIYDSLYGNTEKIAKAMADALAPSNGVKLLRAKDAQTSDLESIDLLIKKINELTNDYNLFVLLCSTYFIIDQWEKAFDSW